MIDWDSIRELGRLPDAELARKLGCDRRSVCQARRVRKIPSARKRGQPGGTEHARAVLSRAQVRRIRRMAARGTSQRDIAAEVGEWLGREVRHTWIGRIVRRQLYASVP